MFTLLVYNKDGSITTSYFQRYSELESVKEFAEFLGYKTEVKVG